jgi:hypothetical protein
MKITINTNSYLLLTLSVLLDLASGLVLIFKHDVLDTRMFILLGVIFVVSGLGNALNIFRKTLNAK